MSDKPLRIHVLGLGAIGGLFAVRLAQSHSVCAILRTPPAALARSQDKRQNRDKKKKFSCQPDNKNGFSDAHEFEQLQISYRQSAELPVVLPQTNAKIDWQLADSREPIEMLLITTKSFQVKSALNSIKARLNRATRIVLIQNGLSSQYEAAERLPEHLLYAATTTEAANNRQPDEVRSYSVIRHASAGITRIGPITAVAEKVNCRDFLAALNQANIIATMETDIWQALWQKFAINCGINAYTAIIGCRNGAILEHELFKRTIRDLSAELAVILSEAGYHEVADKVEQRIRQIASATGNNFSSMLQDVKAGRPTEIEAINGFAVQFARQKGIATPVNSMLAEKVRDLQ